MTTVTEELLGQLRDLERQGLEAVRAGGDAAALEALRTEYLGRKGRLTGVLRRLGELTAEERPAVGAEANRVKEALNALLAEREAAFAGTVDEGPRGDLSLPGRPRWRGG
ncbi:MAG: phenylalanine--tRNA ligase subunit alpha, partial [Gemmatimonadetes bacterium]|nr:phenylalanine--tRNA ligase subunit alpha [Gemmatimonadota bacterium]